MIEKIATPQKTISILQKYNFEFQKKFGQNFLIDLHVLDKIIDGADLSQEDLVIEIGPGIGSLTQVLAENAKKVIAVEIDKKLIPILEDTLKDYNNIDIINEDILKVNINELIMNENVRKVKIIANLPYYITTPIIMGIFEKDINVDSITVMVQKEVADRMQASPGSKDYGALSLAVQFYSEPYIVANVPPNCFMPRPKVGSAVIRLKKYSEPIVDVMDKKLLFRLIRAAFNQRRKTLVNSLANQGGLSLTKEEITQAILETGLSEKIRGEALDLNKFVLLTNNIYKKTQNS
jgi:16S rRNA (adenine1518-N6/adenine1519-N6)-dimethyltransferase